MMASKKDPLAAKECANCCMTGDCAVLKNCARCKLVAYCGKSCQTEHWKISHKKFCILVAERKPHAAAAEPWDANDDNCSICWEVLSTATAAPLPCSHRFLVKCVENLVAACVGRAHCCPVCRAPLPPLVEFIGQVEVGVHLIDCVCARNAATFKGLLSTANSRISLGVTDAHGVSALARAAELNSVSMVVALLRAGASANLPYKGMTPLYIAAKEGNLVVVEALVKAGAAVDQAEADGWTPLLVAAQEGHLAAVEALVKAGAAVDQAEADGATPLYCAAQEGHLAVVEALVKAGAAVDQAEANGATPLYIAAKNGHLAVLEALVKYLILLVEKP